MDHSTDSAASGRGAVISPRLVLGLFLAVGGLLLALDNFGIFDVDPFWEFWPVILLVIGVLKLLQPQQNRGAGVVLILVGSWFLLDNLTDLDLDFGDIFPFLLLLLGFSLVAGALSRRGPRAAAADSSELIEAMAILGAVSRTSNARQFRGGSATAIAGGCELDLRQAAIPAGSEAVIDTFAWWGGVEILVPESWTVVLRGMPVMGGFEDQTVPPPGGSDQRLVIKGLAIMGAVEVKNHKKGR